MQGDSTQLSGARPVATAARKRAAVETIAREGAELRKAARRWSLCEEDAEDAYQRALEIMLVKAPSDRPRELVPWAKTVIKHEALAIRRYRERMLGTEDGDPGAWIPARGNGPEGLAEVGEHVARSREALAALKPAELRSLTLLAAGYSYAEIGEMTGFSRTKVNRCLAEGRDRFRRQLSRSEDGSRCAEMLPLLSAYCDGEASDEDAATVRAHLRACAGCRATMRAYRRVPASVAALAPALPLSPPSLLERAQEMLLSLQARLPGGGGGAADAGVAQVAAAGGAQSAGAAGLAKLLAVCAGAVGSAGACVATGIAPVPLDLVPQRQQEAQVERVSEQLVEAPAPAAVEYTPAPQPEATPQPPPSEEAPEPAPEPEPAPVAEAGAVEYEPPPEPAPAPESVAGSGATAGGAAGEFGP